MDNLILWYFLWINSVYILLIFLSFPEIYVRFREVNSEDLEVLLKSEAIPPISIVAPAYNEEVTIVDSAKSMLNLSYTNVNVILINDGSKDNTMQVLMDNFQLEKVPPAIPQYIKSKPVRGYYKSKLYPKLLVIDKENGGKADSLNAGINACVTPFFMAVDADTLIESDALRRMIRPVLTTRNTVASGGTIRIVNDCETDAGKVTKVVFPKSILPAIQTVEYLRAFLFGRLGWNILGGNLVISGAFGLFNREAVLDVGGYRTDTVGEDMELVVRLHHELKKQKKPFRVEFIPDPVAWTEVPSTLKVLSRQRERWHRGLIDTLWRHREMFMNPRYGITGLFTFPFFVLGELMAPVIEMIGYLGLIAGLILKVIDWKFAMLFFVVAWGLMMILTIFTIIMEETTFKKYSGFKDIVKMILFTIVESLGYRQLTVIWRLQAFYKYLRKDQSWGKMTRAGFSDKTIKAPEVKPGT